MREIDQTRDEKPVAVFTGKRRGRPQNVQETARRVAMLGRVQAGEISNAEAAAELGINLGTWGAWKSGYVKRTGVVPAPIARASVEPTSIPTGKRGRGRPSDPVETARRSGVLERVHAGELSNAQAGKELGITYAVWSGWKANQGKRGGVSVPAPKKVGTRAKVVEPAPEVRATRTPEVAELVARPKRVQRFGAELRRRVLELVAFVEERKPGYVLGLRIYDR